jgi:hypothetical protein
MWPVWAWHSYAHFLLTFAKIANHFAKAAMKRSVNHVQVPLEYIYKKYEEAKRIDLKEEVLGHY